MTDTRDTQVEVQVTVTYPSQGEIYEFIVERDPSHGDCIGTACVIINEATQYIADAGYPRS